MPKNNKYESILVMGTINSILPIVQIILAALLILSIILQRSGSGIEGALGGGDGTSFYNARRGFERFLFNFTVVIAILFVVSTVVAVLI